MTKFDECDSYGIYPFVATTLAIDDTKRGCDDSWLSGRHSALTPCGSCCIFCIPVTISFDIACLVPVLAIWGGRKCIKKCKSDKVSKPTIIITDQPH